MVDTPERLCSHSLLVSSSAGQCYRNKVLPPILLLSSHPNFDFSDIDFCTFKNMITQHLQHVKYVHT